MLFSAHQVVIIAGMSGQVLSEVVVPVYAG